MDAEAITQTVMEEIGPKVRAGEIDNVRYAILRSTDSIISGLSTPTPAPSVIRSGPDTDNDVPLPVKRELMEVAINTGVSYYWLCAIYRLGLRDAGKR